MGDPGSVPGSGRCPGKGNGNPIQYSLAWEILWTEETGGLQSLRSQRVRHDWAANTFFFFLSLLGLGKWNPNHWVTKQDVKEISKRLILLLFTFYLFFFFWEGENSADLVCALNHRDVSKQKWWMGILAAAEMWRWLRLKNPSHGSKRVKTFYFTKARLEWSPGGTDESTNLAWSHLKGDLNDVLWTFFFVNKKPLKFSEAIWKQFVGNKRFHITFGVESCQNMISSFPLRMEEAFLSLQRKQAWRERDE